MVDTTTSRLGAIAGANGTGQHDPVNQDLMLKVFSGEVLKVFDEKQIAKDMVRSRRLSGAKEASFPIMGTAAAGYHLPGTDLSTPGGLINEIQHNERIIKIDYPLVAPVFVSDWDEALNHYEVRAEYAHQLGESLANTWDKLLLRVMASCGTASSLVTGEAAGSVVALGTANIANFIIAAFAAKQKMDENDVPLGERFLIVPPAWESALIQSDTSVLNRDFSPNNGSYADATIGKMAGMTVVTSNHLPQAAMTIANSTGALNSDYNLTATTTHAALAVQMGAVGSVSLWDMEVQSQQSVLHQGTFLISRMSCGAGVLKPAACVPITGAAAPA